MYQNQRIALTKYLSKTVLDTDSCNVT